MFSINPSELDFDTLLQLKNHLSDEPLYLNDFTQEDVQDLIISLKRNSVTAMLVLKGYEHHAYQREVNALTLNARHQMLMSQAPVPVVALEQPLMAKRYRSLPVTGAHDLATEVEMEMTVDMAVDQDLDLAHEVEVPPAAIAAIKFKAFNALCLEYSPIAMSSHDIYQLWCRITALIHVRQHTDGKIYDLAEDELPQQLNPDASYKDSFTIFHKHHHDIQSRISYNAAKFIASHPEAFADGIDLVHLPKGFSLVPNPREPEIKTIDYDSRSNKTCSELSLSTQDKASSAPLAPVVFTKLMSLPLSESKKAKLLHIHEQLNRSEYYNPSDVQAFYQHIPYLLALSDDGFNALIKLIGDVSKVIDAEKLQYLINNHQRLLALTRRSMLHDSTTMVRFKHKGFDKETVETFALDAERMLDKSTPHAGILLLDEVTTSHLDSLNETYAFSWQQYQQFFIIYQTKGRQALQQLFNELQQQLNVHNNRKQRLADVFSFVDYLHLPKDDLRHAMVNDIVAMSDEEYLWWHTLTSQHMAHQKNADVLQLHMQFRYFSSEIKNLGLKFYQPAAFSHIRSMPVALSRMMRILKHCREEDRSLQWQCLTQLPLHATGAIRAIEDASKERPCHFVTPEMGLEGQYYDLYYINGDVTYYYPYSYKLYQYQCAVDIDPHQNFRTHPSTFIPVTEHALRHLNMQAWRLFSHAPQSASFDFYQKALKIIHEGGLTTKVFDEERYFVALRSAYMILAGGSIGINAPQSPEDEANMLQDFKKVVDFFAKMPQLTGIISIEPCKTVIRSMCMESVASLKFYPPFNKLLILLQTYQTIWSKVTITHLIGHPIESFTSIFKSMTAQQILIHARSSEDVIAIFDSFKFKSISSVDESLVHYQVIWALGHYLRHGEALPEDKTTGFLNEVMISAGIKGLLADNKINTACLALIALVSTFNLNKDNILSIDKTFINSQTALYALNLLRQVTHNRNLDVAKLNQFIRALPKDCVIESGGTVIDYQAVHECLKTHFKNHFDDAFFSNLSTSLVDEAIVRLIRNNLPYPTLIKPTIKFLSRFPKHVHEPHVSLMLRLMKALGDEGQSWLKDLVINDVYDIKQENDLATILQTYQTNNNPSHWRYLHSALKRGHLSADVARIMQRYWLTEFMPLMSGMVNAQQLPVDFYDLAFEVKLGHVYEDLDVNIWQLVANGVLSLQQAKDAMMHLLWTMAKNNVFNVKIITSLFALTALKNDIDIMALCEWFASNRLDILTLISQKLPELCDDAKNILFRILKIQANINAHLSVRDLRALLSDDKLLKAFDLFKQAPYPSIKNVNLWLSQDDYSHDYQAFRKKPCEREVSNGFDLEFAKDQMSQFEPCYLTFSDLEVLHQEVTKSKSLTIEQLLKDLSDNPGHATLVARAAELMYRTMGREGDSHEINTTQYLSVLSALKGPNHLIGRVFAGEGKTREFMLLAAIQHALGKTVVFSTQNMPLARREFVDYQSFFDVLAAKRSLISAMSEQAQFEAGAIHFTEASQFERFLNRFRADGQNLLADVPQEELVLLLDEADQLVFDSAHQRYNVSYAKPRHVGDLTWIYPLLAEFFDNPDHQELYHCIDDCNQSFKDFIHARVSTHRWNQFSEIEDHQIESWHRAMMEARGLIFNHHYHIHADEVMMLPGEGRQIFCRAVAITDKREAPESTFAAGVQQCLHALLNLKKEQGNQEASLQAALDGCKAPFILRPENHIVYSTNSHSCLSSFKEARIIGLTGTAGNERERREASALYDFEFIDMPRHNPSKRFDMPKRWCRDEKRQFMALIDDITFSRRMNQPVLLICEDDIETANLSAKLKNHFGDDEFATITAGIKSRQELLYLHQEAGKPNQLTVSTDMLARGANVKLHNSAQAVGLCVLCTFLPSHRDYEQIINRAGRYGAVGRSRLILDKTRCKNQMPNQRIRGTGLFNGFYGFYTHQQGTHAAMINGIDRKNQQHRLIQAAMDEVINHLQALCFSQMRAMDEQKQNEHKSKWSAFLVKASEHRAECFGALYTMIHRGSLVKDDADAALEQFGENLKESWHDLFGNDMPLDDTPKVIDEFDPICQMKESLIRGKGSFFHHYDKAHDGFSARYDQLFAQSRAILRGERGLFANTRAYIRGEGTVFANLKAWLRGEITLKQYLFPVARALCQDNDMVRAQPVN